MKATTTTQCATCDRVSRGTLCDWCRMRLRWRLSDFARALAVYAAGYSAGRFVGWPVRAPDTAIH